jgi:hypothetical protein
MAESFFEIYSPRDLFEKAKRDFVKMDSELNTDNIFNFFVTAYHVMDYVKAQGKARQDAIEKMYDDEDFQMCNYLCNKGKHLKLTKLTKGDPFQTRHSFGAVYGKAMYNEVTYNEKESYSLIAGRKKIDVTKIGQRLLKKWEQFFTDNGI